MTVANSALERRIQKIKKETDEKKRRGRGRGSNSDTPEDSGRGRGKDDDHQHKHDDSSDDSHQRRRGRDKSDDKSSDNNSKGKKRKYDFNPNTENKQGLTQLEQQRLEALKRRLSSKGGTMNKNQSKRYQNTRSLLQDTTYWQRQAAKGNPLATKEKVEKSLPLVKQRRGNKGKKVRGKLGGGPPLPPGGGVA